MERLERGVVVDEGDGASRFMLVSSGEVREVTRAEWEAWRRERERAGRDVITIREYVEVDGE